MTSNDVVVFGNTVHLPVVPPLDPGLYALSQEQMSFFKAATGINDDEALKAHILMVQERAYKVAPYICIHSFAFLRTQIIRQPVYEDILRIGRERKNAILLEMGCCLSVDSRRAAFDGFPACNMVGFDIKKEFMDLSHLLFKTSRETYPNNFVAGDVFDPEILSIVPPTRGPVREQEPPPDLSTLMSLNPLHGRCSVIYLASFFHLFDEEQQLQIARGMASLLSPEPGSIICGLHVSCAKKGVKSSERNGQVLKIFGHDPQSWTEMWDGTVFEKGEVEVEATLVEEPIPGRKVEVLLWSVKRVAMANPSAPLVTKVHQQGSWMKVLTYIFEWCSKVTGIWAV